MRHKVSGEHRFSWSGTRWFHFVRNRLYIGMKYGTGALALMPRFLAYQVKGARNGVLGQGLRAGLAALKLARAFRPPAGQEALYRLTPRRRPISRPTTRPTGAAWRSGCGPRSSRPCRAPPRAERPEGAGSAQALRLRASCRSRPMIAGLSTR
ncbi:hypothetical protein ACFQY5_23830 [Paeniroseomonas aquatica]|uniref:hypothetical protein n=1 Tax=Paeniroseomonas aquatica TaxID=373043 RepID=UPI00360EAA1A